MDNIKLTTETKKQMIQEIKSFFAKERDEEIGDLSAEIFLDFILKNIGPHIYNQAIRDSYSYMSERLEDIFTLEKQQRTEEREG